MQPNLITIADSDQITKTSNDSTGRWRTALFLAFISYGTAMVGYCLMYPSRLIIGEREFVAYQALLEARIIPVSAIPFGLLIWFRQASLPLGYARASFRCLLLDWLPTFSSRFP